MARRRLNEWFPRSEYPEMIAVHLPKHASWLNQIELFFSILGRRALPHFECRDRPTMVERWPTPMFT
jgi:transposase